MNGVISMTLKVLDWGYNWPSRNWFSF